MAGSTTSEKCPCGARVLPGRRCEKCGEVCPGEVERPQLTLDFVREHSHTGDPETSRQAASSVARASAAMAILVLETMESHGEPLAVEQVMLLLPDLAKEQVARRMSDLRLADKIEDSMHRHTNVSGRQAAKWRVR